MNWSRRLLVLNLPAEDDTPGDALATLAAERGEPVHLSLRLLLRVPPRWRVAQRAVYVCENPSITSLADRADARRLGDEQSAAACRWLICAAPSGSVRAAR